MPDQAVYALGATQVLYGVARSTTHYFIQSGADEGAARSPEDAFIDSFEASAAFTNWRAMVTEDVTFVCLSAQQVLPTRGLKYVQFGSQQGTVADEAYPPKANMLITWYATNVYTRKGRSRNWYAGIAEAWTRFGAIDIDNAPAITQFATDLAVIPADFPGGTEYLHSLITDRAPVTGEPLDSETRATFEVRPRLYNLRNSTLKICGAG